MPKWRKISFGSQIWDLKTQVYGGQTPITHNLDKPVLLYSRYNLVSLANDIIYTKIFKKSKIQSQRLRF